MKMERTINILFLLAAASFIIAMAVSYGFLWRVFPAGTFWKFSIGCLGFAITMILMQIRDK